MTLEDFLSIELADGAQIGVRQVGALMSLGSYDNDSREDNAFFDEYLDWEVVKMYITDGWADIEIADPYC
jgi:hypothetical protein